MAREDDATRFSWTSKLFERYFMPGTTFLIEDRFLSGTIKWQTSDEPELFMKPECLGLAHGKESWWVVSSGLWCRGQMLFVTMSVLGVRVFLDGAFIKTFCYDRTGLHVQFVRLQTKGHLLDEFRVRFEVGGGTIS